MTKIIIVDKNKNKKETNLRDFSLNNLFKKANLKNNKDFFKRNTWKNKDAYVSIFAKKRFHLPGATCISQYCAKPLQCASLLKCVPVVICPTSLCRSFLSHKMHLARHSCLCCFPFEAEQ